jgi:hypothetical protein
MFALLLCGVRIWVKELCNAFKEVIILLSLPFICQTFRSV